MSRRRRVSDSSIIGRRRIADHNCQKGTIFPSFLFHLFRSLSNTTTSPTSLPPPAVAVIPKQRYHLGPNHLQSALISFNRMLQMRPLPPISQFNKALGPITKMGHYGVSLSLILNKLQQFQGIQVNLYTFNIAINCYCRLNQVHFGFSLLGSLFKRGFTPDATTFNTLINGLILEDKTPEAVELFKKLITTRE
ncbi:Pentatricopeptide repeat-containing protein, partial [Camellia lanceoleosa]